MSIHNVISTRNYPMPALIPKKPTSISASRPAPRPKKPCLRLLKTWNISTLNLSKDINQKSLQVPSVKSMLHKKVKVVVQNYQSRNTLKTDYIHVI